VNGYPIGEVDFDLDVIEPIYHVGHNNFAEEPANLARDDRLLPTPSGRAIPLPPDDIKPSIEPDQIEAFEAVGKSALRYARPFISYSREDAKEVLFFAQGLAETVPDLFLDLTSLKAGELWSDEIRAAIDRCDVFYLMWSDNAAVSEWVEKKHCTRLAYMSGRTGRARESSR
jgi:hypothetical protein